MSDMKSKIKAFLEEDCKITADDFYDDLYFARFDLGNKIPGYIESTPEIVKARRIAYLALVEKVGSKEAARIDNLLTQSDVRTNEKEYRWFFKQGVKVGYAIHEMLHESED
ncbi:MAG: hypothetical protein E7192_01940 [Erysipelotrichaceae bacterium]|nr:hypothetical protein [Erysipelotrichaceae bacterium]